jgi:hypothetical protein
MRAEKIDPFKIDVVEDVLSDLRHRLERINRPLTMWIALSVSLPPVYTDRIRGAPRYRLEHGTRRKWYGPTLTRSGQRLIAKMDLFI